MAVWPGEDAATGGSNVGPVTTLSGTKALSALTTAEATQLCNDTIAYFKSAINTAIICKWKGPTYATSRSAPNNDVLRQNCTSHETACLNDPGAAWNSMPMQNTLTLSGTYMGIGHSTPGLTPMMNLHPATAGGNPCTAPSGRTRDRLRAGRPPNAAGFPAPPLNFLSAPARLSAGRWPKSPRDPSSCVLFCWSFWR
jgi:hypothetical protein